MASWNIFKDWNFIIIQEYVLKFSAPNKPRLGPLL